MNGPLLRRRAGWVALTLGVALGHWLAMQALPELRVADGSAERMPKRIEVAYVRELTPAVPPAAAPVRVSRPKPAARKAPPPPPAEVASAPEAAPAQVAAAEPPPGPTPEPTVQPEPPASAASAPAEAVAAAASGASAPVAFEWPPSTRLSYRLSGNYRGEVVGGAQVEWARVGSRYQVHLDVWVGAQAAPLVGRRMSSDGELGEQGLTPRRYDEETRALFRELRRRTIVFDGERVLMSNGKQLASVPGLQDAASQFVQMTWLFTTQPQLLKVGNRIEVPLALPNKIDMWAYDVIGTESLNTPFGPVETFHLRPKRERPSKLELVADAWFAPSLQYLPIRLLIRQDEATYVDMMIERLPLQEAPASAPK